MNIKFSNRSIWHWVVGGLAPLSYFLHPSMPWLIAVMFIIYQIKQDRDLAKDKNPDSHLDIYEFITPLIIGLVVLGVLSLMRIV